MEQKNTCSGQQLPETTVKRMLLHNDETYGSFQGSGSLDGNTLFHYTQIAFHLRTLLMMPFKAHVHSLLIAALLVVSITGCDSSDDTLGDDRLVVNEIDTQTAFPALVSVLFKVETRDGIPVTDLTTANFELTDNGEPDSQFESDKSIGEKAGKFKTSVMLVLDLSGSITGSQNLSNLKTAAASFVEGAMQSEEVEISVRWFDGGPSLNTIHGFSRDRDGILDAIDSISADLSSDNTTNLNGAIIDGINDMETHLRISPIQQTSVGVVVYFTDGKDQASRASASAALTEVSRREPGISLYTIGLKGETDEDFLRSVGVTGAAFADNLSSLVSSFTEIATSIRDDSRSYYLLEYCSPRRSGNHELVVRVTTAGATGELKTNYAATGFSGGCST